MDPTSALPDDRPEPGRSEAADLADLLKRSGRGDEAAFAQLYDAAAARVYGLALRVVRDPAQAEEVTQEAFLDVWRTAARYDPARGSAISWLLTIVHRKAVDRVRAAEAVHPPRRRRTTTATTRWSTTRPWRPSTASSRPGGSAPRSKSLTRSSARPWSSRTSAATRTRRWPRCWTCRSAPPRLEYATD